MPDILIWLLALRALSVVAFPAAHLLLGRLADRGWSVSAALGLLLLAWTTWLGGSVGIIPNSPAGIGIALLALAGLSGWLAYWQRAELADFFQRRWLVVIATELMFLAMFVFWALVVSEAPAINHTEKPMDFGIMNAIARADGFPPEDHWLAGHSIAYYYGGHYVAALLAQLTGVANDVAYNLAIATVPALLAAGLLGIGYNLLRLAGARMATALLAGAAMAIAIPMLGNLVGMLELAYARGIGGAGFWQWVGIKDLTDAPAAGASGWLPDGSWWWWRSTRVIDTLGADGVSLDYTITEFPFFSFLLGDLHAHLSALPFAVLALALAMALLASPTPPGLDWVRRRPWECGALVLSVGALAFINAWDFPLYIAIVGAAAALRWYSYLTAPSTIASAAAADAPPPIGLLRQAAGRALLLAAGLAAGGVILYLPFYMSLDSQASGVLPVLGPATRPLHFLLVMGAPALLAAAPVIRAALLVGWPAPALRPVAVAILAASVAPLLLWLLAAGLRISVAPDGLAIADAVVAQRLALALPLLLMGGLAAYCALACAAGRRDRPPMPWLAFALLLAAAGFGLLAIAELFHIADHFGNRMNTVFKVYYQAWLLLGIAGGVGIYCIVADPLRRRGPELGQLALRAAGIAYAAPVAILLLASAYYPVGAVIDRTGWTQPGATWSDNTLSGLAYLRRDAPGEYAAIAWLNDIDESERIPGRIVEAVGDDYTDSGRIAAATGRASVLGWPGHERQWRGDDAAFAGRAEDVADIYGSGDGTRVSRLLQRYGVRWVIVGPRELDAYGDDAAARMDGWADAGQLREVFAEGNFVIYEVVE